MSFWGCDHDWQPSAKSYAAPCFGAEVTGRGREARMTIERLAVGYTTLIYKCAKCKDLRREGCLGQGDLVTK